MANYFYEDEARNKIREELLTTRAKSWAKSFCSPKQYPEKGKKNPPLTSAQLRRFHFEVKHFEEILRHKAKPEEEFEKLRPMIKMIKSKAAYACRIPGKDRKVPEEFQKYLDEMIDNVTHYKDFNAFALCFEAVVGYFYGEGGK